MNDLVKRLREKRERFHDLSGVYWSDDMLCQEAADRIAELEAALREGIVCTTEHYGAARFLKVARAALGEKKDG